MKKTLILLLISLISSAIWAQDKTDNKIISHRKSFFPISIKSKNRPTVAVVLGGGGARGISHIGALKVLEEWNIPIDMIIGVSMGSIIGGLYAAGYTPSELEDFVLSSDWDDLLKDDLERKTLLASQQEEGENFNLSFRFKGIKPYIPLGLSSGQKLRRRLNRLFLQAPYNSSTNFDDFKIPFRSVVLDLNSGKPIVFSEGDIVEILRASIAIPLIISPIEKDGMLLTDGGIVNALPTDVARDLGADIVIAFDVVSPLRNPEDLRLPWEIADQIITIMMQPALENLRKLADVLVTPQLSSRLPTDFSNLSELIDAGRIATEEIISDINLLLNAGEEERIGFADSLQKDYQDLNQSTITISKVTLSGNSEYSTEELLKASGFHNNRIYNAQSFDEALESMIRIYRNGGYSLAAVHSVSYDSTSSSLDIKINEGLINSISIEGNYFTSDHVIFGEFPMTAGDLFNIREADRGLNNIYATRFFRQVSLSVEKAGDGHKIILRVVEQPYIRVLIGIRSDRERNTIGKIEIRHENLFGSGNSISLSGTFGERDIAVRLRYRTPRLGNSFLTNGIKFDFGEKKHHLYGSNAVRVGEYEERRFEGSFLIGAQVRRFGSATGEILLINTKIRGLSERGFGVESINDIVAIRLRSTVDRRNKISIPTEGLYSRFSYTFASRSFSSEIGYTSLEWIIENYNTINNRLTFRPYFRFAIGDLTLPFSEQFRLGGRSMIYGTRENRFVARKLFHTSFEIRYRMPVNSFVNTYISLRYDVGQAVGNPETPFSIDDFISGYGGALIIETPIGPAGIEWGRSSEGIERLYITAGYEF